MDEPGTVLMSRTLNELHTKVSGPDENPPMGAKVDTENPDSEANRSISLNQEGKGVRRAHPTPWIRGCGAGI
jgi:hypothetical protein